MDHSLKREFAKMHYFITADAHRLLETERIEVYKNIAIMLRERLPINCVRCVVTATLTMDFANLIDIFDDKPDVIDAFRELKYSLAYR